MPEAAAQIHRGGDAPYEKSCYALAGKTAFLVSSRINVQ